MISSRFSFKARASGWGEVALWQGLVEVAVHCWEGDRICWVLDFMQNESKSLKQKKSPSTKMVATLCKKERTQDKEK